MFHLDSAKKYTLFDVNRDIQRLDFVDLTLN